MTRSAHRALIAQQLAELSVLHRRTVSRSRALRDASRALRTRLDRDRRRRAMDRYADVIE